MRLIWKLTGLIVKLAVLAAGVVGTAVCKPVMSYLRRGA